MVGIDIAIDDRRAVGNEPDILALRPADLAVEVNGEPPRTSSQRFGEFPADFLGCSHGGGEVNGIAFLAYRPAACRRSVQLYRLRACARRHGRHCNVDPEKRHHSTDRKLLF